MNTIKELGKALCSINLLIVGDDTFNVFEIPMIDYIIKVDSIQVNCKLYIFSSFPEWMSITRGKLNLLKPSTF